MIGHSSEKMPYRLMCVEIVRWVDDAQPGFVACRLIDAWGAEHTFIDKLPLVSDAWLGNESVYPQPGVVACVIIARRQDTDGRELITVDTECPWNMETTTGRTQFEVLSEQLLWDAPLTDPS